MKKPSKYISKSPNKNGIVEYSSEDTDTWNFLLRRQNKLLEGRACLEFIEGVKLLRFTDNIPQHFEVSEILRSHTGWAIEPVPCIIPASEFFNLLANKKFPCANFIRTPEDIDYIVEPDIFHEIYGHAPLLTNQAYADFMQEYGKLALKTEGKLRMRLFRLFWFTIEFGLLKENGDYRAYGGGILSSKNETIYSIDSETPEKQALLNPMEAFRTPYRIDVLQPLYFVIENLNQLFQLFEHDLIKMAKESIELGSYEPKYPPKSKKKGTVNG